MDDDVCYREPLVGLRSRISTVIFVLVFEKIGYKVSGMETEIFTYHRRIKPKEIRTTFFHRSMLSMPIHLHHESSNTRRALLHGYGNTKNLTCFSTIFQSIG
jgi:hypothetical protein